MVIAFTLFIVFLALKIAKVITWSWWLVTSPAWGYVILFLAIIGIKKLALNRVKKCARCGEKYRHSMALSNKFCSIPCEVVHEMSIKEKTNGKN